MEVLPVSIDGAQDDATSVLPVTAPIQAVEDPGQTRRFFHSLQYYLAVVGVWPILAWISAGWLRDRTAFGIAVSLSLVAGTLYLLRILRGSLLDHEVEQQQLRQYVQEPYVVTNRIGKKLERNERVIWETRLHPLALVAVWRQHIFSAAGLAAVGAHVVIFMALVVADGRQGFEAAWWMYLGLLATPTVYAAFTILEWNCERYAITTRRIIAVQGIFRTQYLVMTRVAITDCWTITPMMSHFLAWLRVIRAPYGTWNLETPGQVQALNSISFIPDAADNMTTYPPKP